MRHSKQAQRMAKIQSQNNKLPKLNLVSLMDIFTILVFFLLVNSSDVEVLQNHKDITLPTSSAEKKPANALTVMVTKNDILVEGNAVDKLSDYQGNDSDEYLKGLKKELEYRAAKRTFSNDEEAEQGWPVIVMGDASIPYRILKKIMATCAETDYRRISLAVSQVPKSTSDGQEAQ